MRQKIFVRRFARAASFAILTVVATAAFGAGPSGGEIDRIIFDSSSPDIMFAIASGGTATHTADTRSAGYLFRSMDGGHTWSRASNFTMVDAAIDPGHHASLFAVTPQDVWRTTDRGNTWRRVGYTGSSRQTSIIIDPHDSAIYVGADCEAVFKSRGAASFASDAGVFRSYDDGVHWIHLTNELCTTGLTLDPSGSIWATSTAAIAGTLHSDDHGESWQALPQTMQFDRLAFSPANANRIFASSNGDHVLYRSDDRGTTWTAIDQSVASSAGLPAGIAADPSNADRVLAATSGGLYLSADAGETWTRLADRPMFDVGIHPQWKNVVVAGAKDGLLYSSDGGATLTDSTGVVASTITSISADPADPDRIRAATIQGDVYGSNDGGISWTRLTPALAYDITSIATAPDSSAIFGVSYYRGTYRSSDGGATWDLVRPAPSGPLLTVAVDPKDPSIVWTGGFVVEKSENSGDNWYRVLFDPFSPVVHSIAIDPLDTRNVYLGTDRGIYRSTNSGDDWDRTSDSGISVIAIAVDPKEPAHVYAAASVSVNGSLQRRLVTSGDWGVTWKVTDFPASAVAANPLTGQIYAAIDGSGIYRSGDHGRTWGSFLTWAGFPESVATLAVDPAGKRLLIGSVSRGVEIKSLVETARRRGVRH
ncbi:MAG: hypothetical protein WBX15_12735 [Thermoanaerobaculia bacterium]